MGTTENFWKPNLDRRGQLVRFVPGLVLCLAGLATGFWLRWWVGMIISLAGAFMVFEAARRWCVLRAYGFKTRF